MNRDKKIAKFVLFIGIAFVISGIILIMTKKSDEPKLSIDEQNLKAYPYYQVVTARYDTSQKDAKLVEKYFGENAIEKFNNFFKWYNVVHELTHGLIMYNNNESIMAHMLKHNESGYIEEQKVNDFAVAYWKKYGDPLKFQLLKETVNYIIEVMDDPTNGIMTLEEYAKEMWKKEEPTFEEYGWFQFNSVKSSIEKDLSLEETFNNLGLDKKANFDEEKLSYGEIDETTCDNIIKDTINKFKKWGMIYPEVTHTYSNDPNMNYSMPTTKENYELLK